MAPQAKGFIVRIVRMTSKLERRMGPLYGAHVGLERPRTAVDAQGNRHIGWAVRDDPKGPETTMPPPHSPIAVLTYGE
jgi:hypothetical protein